MRKTLLIILAMVLYTVLPVKAEIYYYLPLVDFEDGTIPQGWTQQNIKNSVNWAVEGGEGVALTTPDGARSGNHRLYSRLGSDNSQRYYVTRLITPAIDLSGDDVTDPMLVFSYANPAIQGYFDTLKVYVKPTAASSWQLLDQFKSDSIEEQDEWKLMRIALPNYTFGNAYQVAFEVVNHGGKGVVIDDIAILQPSQCDEPAIQSVDIRRMKVDVQMVYTGNPFVYYSLVLSENAINLPNTETVELPSGAEWLLRDDFDYIASKDSLKKNSTYHLYYRQTCLDNALGYTNWAHTTFATSELVEVPYLQRFDSATIAGWNFGRSQGLSGVPAILAASADYSIDSTKYLYFGASTTPTSTASELSNGQYVYAVSPELSNADANEVEVSFWATTNTHIVPGQTESKLIVGVMSNAADYKTFVPVDTVALESSYQFKHFVVSLTGYTGTAQFIAFVAKGGAQKNVFALDNVEIRRVGTPVPSGLKLKAITPSQMTLEVKMNGADSWNLLIGDSYVRNGVPATIISQPNLTSNTTTVALPDSLAGKVIVIYAQDVKNGVAGEWAFPLTVRVPEMMANTVPQEFTFGTSTPTVKYTDMQNYIRKANNMKKSPANLYYAPKHVDYIPMISSSKLKLDNAGNYFTLGYLETLNDKEITFYLQSGSSASTTCKVALGVMTNPYDESTFVELAQFEGKVSTTAYSRCRYDLDQYQGQGHYLAIKALGAKQMIQKIELTEIPTCREVVNVAAAAGTTRATLTWDANNMTEWQVVVSSNSTFTNIVFCDTVQTNSCVATGLTPEQTYYYKVNTLCGSELVEQYDYQSFTTKLGVPYEQSLATFPSNWTKMTGLASSVFDGGSMTTTTSGWGTNTLTGMGANHKVNIYGTTCKYWMVTPSIYLDVPAGSSARLTFDAAFTDYNNADAPESVGTDDKFIVAISTDNGATWDQANAFIWAQDGTGNMGLLSTISHIPAKIAIDLTAFVGQSVKVGFYAESTTSNADNDFHVANVRFEAFDPNCPGISVLTATGVSANEASVVWQMSGTQSADIEVSTSDTFADSTLVYGQTVSTSPVTISGLAPRTLYYVRAKQTCDPNETWKTTTFRTFCSGVTPAEFGTETFSQNDALECWGTGHLSTGKYSGTDATLVTLNSFGKVLKMAKSATYFGTSDTTTYDDGQYAFSPEFILDSVYDEFIQGYRPATESYQIVFEAFTTSNGTNDLNQIEVGVLTDPSDLSSFEKARQPIVLEVASDSTTMRQYVVSLKDYVGDYNGNFGSRVMFYAASGDKAHTVYIDNVRLEHISNCPQVTEAIIGQITSDSVSLHWSTTGAASYEVAVFNNKQMDSIMSTLVVTDTTAVLPVPANTNVFVGVRAICAAGDTAAWSPLTAEHSECQAISSFPWTEDFDSYAAGNLAIDCWTNEHIAGSSSYLMQIASESSIDNNTKVFKLSDQQTGNKTRVELPYVDIPEANQYEFRLDMRRSNYSSIKQNEGFVITAEAGDRIDTLAILPRQYTISNDYVEAVAEAGWYRYGFTIPQAGGQHIVIYGISEYGAASYADNFEIRHLPTCPAPKKVVVDGLWSDTVALHWVGEQADYVVELSADEAFAELADSVVVAGDTAYVFRNLGADMTYYVRVRRECEGAEWTEASFHTCMSLPLVEDFQAGTSLPDQWVRYSGDLYTLGGFSETTSNWYVSSSAAVGLTANHLYSSTYNSSYSGVQQYALALPTTVLNSEAGNNVILSFKAGVCTSSSGSSAITDATGRHFDIAVSLNAGRTWQKDTAIAYTSLTNAAQEYAFDLTQYAGQAVQVAFFHYVDTTATSSYSYLHIDDVKLQSINLNCLAPLVSASAVGTDSISLVWEGDATKTYIVEIAKNKGFTPYIDSVSVNDTVLTFHNLQAATTYYVRAKVLCEAGASSGWSEALAITTECAVVSLPFDEDFNSLTAGVPNCWDNSQGSMTTETYKWNYNALGATGACVRMNSYSATNGQISYLATPEIYLHTAAKLTFDAKNPTGGDYSVLIRRKGATTSATLLTGLTGLASWTAQEVDLADYIGDTVQIIFKGVSNYGSGDAYLYLDNVAIHEIPATKTLLAVEATKVTRVEAALQWKLRDNDVCKHFELVTSTTALNDSLLEAAQKTLVDDTTAYTVRSLNRNTTYYIYVRTNCDSLVGDWVSTSLKTKALSFCGDIVVAEGTSTTSYAPVYGSWCDAAQMTQSIYPASMLTEVVGQPISALHYYVTSGDNAGKWDNSIFKVRFAIVPDATFATTSYYTGTKTEVYSGTLTANTNDDMVITLNQPYIYNGGNLLIEFEQPTASGYVSVSFAGVSATGSTLYGYMGSSSSTYSCSASSTLPMVGFQVCYDLAACPTVDTAYVELLGTGTSAATISWPATEGDYAGPFEFCYSADATANPDSIAEHFTGIDSLSITLNDLTESTTYYCFIRSICNAEGHDEGTSTWYSISFKTYANCPAIVGLQAAPSAKTEAKAEWATLTTEQEQTFYYVLSTSELTASQLAAASLTEVDTAFATFSGLTTGETYHLYVASKCGDSHSSFEHVSFTQPTSCPAVDAVHVAKVAFNAVTLTWTPNIFGEEAQWEAGIVGQEARAQVVSDTTAIFFGLEAETQYTAYVKALCSATEESALTTVQFTTSAVPSDNVEIGEGSSTISSMPTQTYYNYTTSEQIYTAEEIGTPGVIQSIAFYVANSYTRTRDIKVYLKHVAESEFGSTTDWFVVDDQDKVYEGQYDFTGEGWNTIAVSDFAYDGENNLLVVVDDNTGTYVSTALTFASYETTAYQAMYINSDDTNLDPTNPGSTSGSRTLNKNQIQLGFEAEDCRKVTNLKVSNIEGDHATASWYPGGSELSWNTVLSTTELTEVELAAAAMDSVTAITKQLTGLANDADYYFYVRSICSANEFSKWNMVHFISEASCKIPTELTAEATDETAALSWHSEMAAQGYVVAYGLADSFDLAVPASYQTLTVTDTVASITGLSANTAYKAAVKTQCDAQSSSRWSEPVAFRTACGATAVFPWKEDFESYTTGDFEADCWRNEHVAGSSTYVFQVYQSYSDNNKRMQLLDQQAGNKTMLVLPAFRIAEADEYGFSLDVNRTHYSTLKEDEGLQIYVSSTDTLDASAQLMAFVPRQYDIDGVNVSAEASDDVWYNYEFPIPAQGDVHIIILGVSEYGKETLFDNLKVRRLPECKDILGVKVSAGAREATVRFTANGAPNYQVVVTTKAINPDTLSQVAPAVVAANVTVDTAKAVVTGLSANSDYYVYVRSACAGGEFGEWSKGKAFSTLCLLSVPYTQDFDDEDDRKDIGVSSYTAYTIPACWNEIYDDNSYYSCIKDNSTYNGYAFEGGAMQMRSYFYSGYSGEELDKSFLILPQLEDSLEGLQLTFKARAMYTSYSSYSGTSVTNYASSQYAHSVRVGYVTDPEDMSTFVEIQTYVYPEVSSVSSITDDPQEYWRDVIIPLHGGTGKYLVLASDFEGANNYLYIDNLEINTFNANCLGIDSLTVENITTAGADVRFVYNGGARNAVLDVASDALFETIIATASLTGDSTYHVSGTQASSTYYVRVKQICGGGEESAYKTAHWSTPLGVPYVPDFSKGLNSLGWTGYSYLVTDAQQTFQTSDFTSGASWNIVNADTVIDAAHIRGNIYGPNWKYWEVTPSIDLTSNLGDGLMLYVDLGLTPYSSYASTNRNNGVDDRFMIFVSEDGGISWDQANATVWNNDTVNPGDYSYNAIEEHATTYQINMTPYAGKVIALGFYGESTSSNADNYFHFGNVRLSTVTSTVYEDTICGGVGYTGYGFKLKAKELVPGQVNVFDHFTPQSDTLAYDSITVLKLYVRPELRTDYNDTVCAGYDYSGYGFEIPASMLPAQGKYDDHLNFVGTNGCDSLVVLNLTVLPTVETEEVVRFCRYKGYVDVRFKGETVRIYQDAVLRDSTTSVVTGCDSIHTIRVIMTDIIEEPTHVHAAICAGETYDQAPFSGLSEAGVYTDTIRGEQQCDSVVTLHLMVVANGEVFDTIRVDELPYVLNGQELFDEETQPGVHDNTIQICNEMVTVHLMVEGGTQLEGLKAEDTYVPEKFIYNERVYIRFGGMIFNSIGQRVTLE